MLVESLRSRRTKPKPSTRDRNPTRFPEKQPADALPKVTGEQVAKWSDEKLLRKHERYYDAAVAYEADDERSEKLWRWFERIDTERQRRADAAELEAEPSATRAWMRPHRPLLLVPRLVDPVLPILAIPVYLGAMILTMAAWVLTVVIVLAAYMAAFITVVCTVLFVVMWLFGAG